MNIGEMLKFAKLDDSTLLRLLFIALFMFFCLAPGISFIFLEGHQELLVLEPVLYLGTSILISAPFLFLGMLIYLHPRQTLVELYTQKTSEAKWSLLLGCGLWSLIAAGVTYTIVNESSQWLNTNISDNRIVQYFAVWASQVGIFGSIFFINGSRKIKS